MKTSIFILAVIFCTAPVQARPETVTIGSQVWTKNNLQRVKYLDGTPMPQAKNATEWSSFAGNKIGAYCYFNFDSAKYAAKFGKLYNWYAAQGIWNTESFNDPAKRKQLAPQGFHTPTWEEWRTLANTLGGWNVAGGKLKQTGTTTWAAPNTGASNSSGFTATAGGIGYDLNESLQAHYWTSDIFCMMPSKSFSSNKAMYLSAYSAQLYYTCVNQFVAAFVRCVKD